MSETPKNPFTMVGAEHAEACIDGVCEVPAVQESASDAARAVQAAAVASALATSEASAEEDPQS